MKILAIADEECRQIYEYYKPGMMKDNDLILSAGDLHGEYLSFIVTMANRPLLYVPGNHDGRYATRPPEGCDNIDGKLVKINGLRVLGLGGSYMYNGGPHQYTERQMRARIRRLRFKLWRYRGVDVVLSHAPVYGYGDMPDLAHRGFECFQELIDKYQPKLWIHGHVHQRYGTEFVRVRTRGSTRIVNACAKWEGEV